MTKASKEGQRKAPILRFKGFTDAWEQRKLGEMITERKILRFDSREFPLSSFIKNEGVVPKSSRYDRSFLVKSNSKKYKETRLGDFIYSSNNLDTGSIGLNNYGNAVISPVYSIFTSKDTENLETSFINLLFKKNFYKNKMLRFRQGVTYGQWKIKENDFLNLKVYISNSVEIEKIIAIFSKISQCITLYDRKTKLIKQIQSSFLDCFFSETNNVTSLNHFLRIRNGYAFKSSELTENGEIPVVKISNIGSNKPFTFTTKAKSKEQFTLYPNDIIIALSGATAGKINQVANKYPLYYQNQRVGFFEIKNDRLNCEYLNSFLHSKKFKSQLQKTLVAGAQPNITPKDIEKIKIPFLEYELQQTIGQVNKYLFELQRINKDKLTLLNKIKKTLLNNMFV